MGSVRRVRKERRLEGKGRKKNFSMWMWDAWMRGRRDAYGCVACGLCKYAWVFAYEGGMWDGVNASWRTFFFVCGLLRCSCVLCWVCWVCGAWCACTPTGCVLRGVWCVVRSAWRGCGVVVCLPIA